MRLKSKFLAWQLAHPAGHRLPPPWRLFLPQMLISGGQQGLDIADMRAHCQYSGGYHEEHPVVAAFWAALATFTPDEQAAFLRFVTSCPRPPLLGFKYLEPPLGIQVGKRGVLERPVSAAGGSVGTQPAELPGGARPGRT